MGLLLLSLLRDELNLDKAGFTLLWEGCFVGLPELSGKLLPRMAVSISCFDYFGVTQCVLFCSKKNVRRHHLKIVVNNVCAPVRRCGILKWVNAFAFAGIAGVKRCAAVFLILV